MQNSDITISLEDINSQFNKELLELLCSNDDDDSIENDTCLISNNKLVNPIKLVCGHKFNYDSILNEVKGQKKYNSYETQKLGTFEIKCPYCRTVQKGLLPYREGYEQINNVNWPPRFQFKPNKCSYTFLSGKRKGLPCDKPCIDKFCKNHKAIMDKRAIKKSYNKKKKLNEEFANSPLANVIIDLSNEEYNNTCAYVFKRGKNKGKHCSCKKLFNYSTHCKKHYKYI